MKFDIKNIILLVLVLIVWVFVYVRYKGYKAPNHYTSPPKINEVSTSHHTSKQEPYTLLLNYKDPFLDHIPKRKHTNSNSNTSSNKELSASNNKTESGKKVTIPAIQYLGMVANRTSNNMAALCTINGKQTLCIENKLYGKLLLQRIYRDSLVVAFHDQTYTITR